MADIREHGLREPITLHPDGSILDGRNRYRACQKAGVEPRFRTVKDDLLAFVISENIRRRHLQKAQGAAIVGLAEQLVLKVLAEAPKREKAGKKDIVLMGV